MPFAMEFLRDPLLAVGTARGGAYRWIVYVAVTAVCAVVYLVLPWTQGAHGTLSSDVKIVRAAGGLAWAFLAVPSALWVYLWLPDSLSRLVPEMRARGLLADPTDQPVLDELADAMRRRIYGVWWPLLGLVAAGIATAVLILVAGSGSLPTWLWGTQVVTSALLVFGAAVLVGRLVYGTFKTLEVLRRAEPRVVPLHADDAGGWSVLGHRAVVLGRAAALYALVALLVNIGVIRAGGNPLEEPASVVTFVALLALPPFVVAAWLLAPHRAMLLARERAIEPVSLAFNEASLDGIAKLSGDGPSKASGDSEASTGHDPVAAVRARSDWLDELKRRREQLADAYPAWPLRLVELRAIWATALLPSVTAAVSAVSDRISDWIAGA